MDRDWLAGTAGTDNKCGCVEGGAGWGAGGGWGGAGKSGAVTVVVCGGGGGGGAVVSTGVETTAGLSGCAFVDGWLVFGSDAGERLNKVLIHASCFS